MTRTKEVEALIQAKGLKKKYVAEQLGLSPWGFQLKLNNKNEFFSSEISKLCEILGIDDLEEKERLFFADEVD